MKIAQIENNLQKLQKNLIKESFIYDLLLAYGLPKATIKRIKDGGLNLSKVEGEIAWKKKLFFKPAPSQDLHELIAEITTDNKVVKQDPRFVVVTDYKTLLAVDTKTQDTLDISITDIAKHFDFFLPWAGMEKAQHQNENPADVRAAEKMAKLYDDIKKDNPTKTPAEVHNLNVFLSRLLFCFFAEDTGILEKGQFTLGIGSHTQQDGSDLNTYLDNLFEVMNTKQSERASLPNYLRAFPYVNGGLFRNEHSAPIFTRKSRQSVIDSGELDWSAINPDIFGSMIQAVITPEHRGGLGMHYTSVPNIMKVIEPLFLNELYEEFEVAKGNNKKLNALLQRIWNIKIFDPACGSGNFLIIAYKELRKLEIAIIKEYDKTRASISGFSEIQLSFLPKAQLRLGDEEATILQFDSRIKLSHFFGIELDDFAHEVAVLSLWLAEHQMNQQFFKEFGRTKPALPLTETGNIVHGNATRVDWQVVCPKEKGDEIYVLGNPPYKGSRNQDSIQKSDMKFVFKSEYKSLDYIACWFLIGGEYIQNTQSKLAFVSTNSISQGEQVAHLWPRVLNINNEIFFAHQSFKWSNNAKDKAGVTVVIIGLQTCSKSTKKIYFNNSYKIVDKINPYLTSSNFVNIVRRSKPISSWLPKIVYGSLLNDKGYLTIDTLEKIELESNFPSIKKYIKKFIGADEFIKGKERWCLYIKDEDISEAREIPEIERRLNGVINHRIKSSEKSTREMAQYPNRFYFSSYNETESLIIPRTSSENRPYIPIGFLAKEEVISDGALAIYDAKPWLFSVISCRMHMTWILAVCGSLEMRIRYSSALGYNSFPFPNISENQKNELERHVYNVLGERQRDSEKSLAQLYNPEKMPVGLREAHHQLDLAVERCYRAKPFETDEERLEFLFKLYEQMIEEEKSKGTLFETKPKRKKRKK